MKLTASDLDAAIYRGDREPLRVVRMRNGTDERIVLTDAAAIDDLPPLDVPQATEPEHIGASFKAPPPRMWDVERTTPYFLPACVLMVVLGAFLPPLLRWLGS